MEGREEGIARQRRKGIRHKKVTLMVRCYQEDGELKWEIASYLST
jgi:hypothetical protein